MCLIVDNNIVGMLVARPAEPCHASLWKWLREGGCLTLGGQLADEVLTNTAFRRIVLQFWRSGRWMRESDMDVRNETKSIAGHAELTSDDPHVIALARVSGARLLFSHDVALVDDFKNPRLVDSPRGKVYCGPRRGGGPRPSARQCIRMLNESHACRIRRRRSD